MKLLLTTIAFLASLQAFNQTVELSYSQPLKTAVEATVFANNSPIGLSVGYAEGKNYLVSFKAFVQHEQFLAQFQPGIYIGPTKTDALFRTGVGLMQGKTYLMLNFTAINRLKLETGFGVAIGYKF